MSIQHRHDKLQIVSDPVLQFPCENIVLVNQPPQGLRPRLSCNSFGKHVGKAGQKTDVVSVVGMWGGAIDLQYTVGWAVVTLDQYVNR